MPAHGLETWLARNARPSTLAVAEVATEIAAAFTDVSREGGVSWREAKCLDLYGLDESEIENLYSDTDRAWTDLVMDAEWNPDPGVGGLCFLDPIGFRYYLPACMIRTLAEPWDVDVAFWLTPKPDSAEWYTNKWSIFTAGQLRAVAHFVREMGLFEATALLDEGFDDMESDWILAYESYCNRHDPKPIEILSSLNNLNEGDR